MKHALLLFIGLLYFPGNAQNLLVNGSAELVENSQIVGWTPNGKRIQRKILKN